MPPKKLRCQNTGGQSAVADTSGTPTNTDGSAVFIPGLDASAAGFLPSLPARMSNWSWTLFYLNGV